MDATYTQAPAVVQPAGAKITGIHFDLGNLQVVLDFGEAAADDTIIRTIGSFVVVNGQAEWDAMKAACLKAGALKYLTQQAIAKNAIKNATAV